MQNKISVDMGDYKTTSKGDLLQTIGLGSCVATCLYDSETKVAGLSHILAAKSYETDGNPRKFADKAIDLMLAEMVRMGAKKERVKAKIFGGANMFPHLLKMTIGNDNVAEVKSKLKELNIPITAEDTGGTNGRSVWFDPIDGSVVMSQVHGTTKQF